LAVGIWLLGGGLTAATGILVGGILIDLDHILEYLLHFGLPFRRRTFFKAAREHIYPRYYLFAHSWELCGLLWLLAALTCRPFLWGLAGGSSLHLILDQLGNPCHFFTYSFLWRAGHGFRTEAVFPPERVILCYPYLIDRYRPKFQGRTD